MNYVDLYKRRVGVSGVTNAKLRLIYEARKNFERTLMKDPSAITTKVTDVGAVNISDDTKLIPCIINDLSNNDQKAFDEKMMYVRHDENVGIGSYVEFDNCIWLVIFKEHKSSDAYKSFVIRKCNQIIKYEYKGEIYDIPCVVKNLTQYSDGLQDIVYTSTPDSRRSIIYSRNIATSNIGLGHRFMINQGNVYRVTHIQDFEFVNEYGSNDGIASCIAVYTSMRNEDDFDNNLAFNDSDSSEGIEDVLTIGSNATYRVDSDGCTWDIEYTSNFSDYVDLSANNGVCKVAIDMNFDLIGETFKLKALSLDSEVIFEKNITIVDFI